MVKPVVLVAGSAIILGVSWRSLRDRRSHGFYHFFAGESILLNWIAGPLIRSLPFTVLRGCC